MIWAILATCVAFFSTLLGGFTALRWPRHIESLMALAGGVVLAAAFFDLLPDAVQRAINVHMSVGWPIGAVLVGYLLFHTVEGFVHHHHEESESSAAGIVGAVGFVVHSFFDGLAIGLGFRIDSTLGLLVAVAVIGHDFSDGLNTVSYLVAHRQPHGRSVRMLIADAVAPLIGAIVGSLAPVPQQVFPVALGFFSGLFVYAAATNLLPRARSLPASQGVPITLGGAVIMFLITRLA
ncbi:MAG TPA: ZIP family metal transporter [Chloroflexota bacterium]